MEQEINFDEMNDRDLLRLHNVSRSMEDPRTIAEIAAQVRLTGSPAVKNSVETQPVNLDTA